MKTIISILTIFFSQWALAQVYFELNETHDENVSSIQIYSDSLEECNLELIKLKAILGEKEKTALVNKCSHESFQNFLNKNQPIKEWLVTGSLIIIH